MGRSVLNIWEETVKIYEWRQGLEAMPARLLWQSVTLTAGPDHSDRSQPQHHNCPKLNKGKCSQFWTEGSCFQENHLENSSFMWFVSGSVYCLEVPQKHSPVLQHSAPKVAGGFGSGKQRGDSHLAHTLPTCSCRQASLSSLLLPLAVFSKECWNFMSSCSIHPLFTKFHMLLPLSSQLYDP